MLTRDRDEEGRRGAAWPRMRPDVIELVVIPYALYAKCRSTCPRVRVRTLTIKV